MAAAAETLAQSSAAALRANSQAVKLLTRRAAAHAELQDLQAAKADFEQVRCQLDICMAHCEACAKPRHGLSDASCVVAALGYVQSVLELLSVLLNRTAAYSSAVACLQTVVVLYTCSRANLQRCPITLSFYGTGRLRK